MNQENLPLKIFSLCYWLKSIGNAITVIEVIIDGFDIRADENLKLILIVRFHTKDDRQYRYRYDDVLIAKTRQEATIMIKRVEENEHIYPVTRQEYRGV
jgi:hypothetical protein